MTSDWAHELRDRVLPLAGDVALTAPRLGVVAVIALLVVAVGPVWRVARLAVTLVHELGHAFVGIAVGRQFTGFVLRGDMSGHAVTKGRPRGIGKVVTTWAGYPAPAVVGAALVWLAARGWSSPALTVTLVLLLASLVRVRSLLTATVMLVVLAAAGALWWWRDDALQAQALVGLGLVLLVGAWRHLGAVFATRGGASDPGVLAALTHVPTVVWNATFVAVSAAATWLVVTQLGVILR